MALDRDSLCPIGKHAGLKMSYIMETNASYLVWALENMTRGDVFQFAKEHEQEIRSLAIEQKQRGPGDFKPKTSSRPTSKPNYSTPVATDIYHKLFKTAFTLLSPGAQLGLKDYWKDQGVVITGVREDDVDVKINQ